MPVPVLDAALLPDSLRDWLTDIAGRMQCPLEFPSAAALICIAGLIGNKIKIRPQKYADWTVTVNLWGAVVGKPGAMKTPALDEVLKPLKSLERAASKGYLARLREVEFNELEKDAKRGILKSEIKKAVKENRDTGDLMAEFLDFDAQAIAPRRYIVNDSTIEKIVELLVENPNGLLLYRDELMGWIRSFDRNGRQQDRQFYLEAWNGSGNFICDRIVCGTTHVESLTVSILGGIQPAPLSAYLNSAIAGNKYDDGFIQRFQLLVYPDLPANWKKVDRRPNESAAQRTSRIFTKLDSLAAADVSAGVDGKAAYLRFSDEAQPFFDAWQEVLEHKLRGNHYEHPAIEAHFAKYRSLMPSLALIFHLVEAAAGEVELASSVSLAAARKAADWCGFLEQHAYRIYGMALNANSQIANIILKKIREGKLKNPFAVRDIYRKQWTGLQSPELCAKPLEMLVEFGWLQRFVQSPSVAGGRPTAYYYAHPSIFREAENKR